jgi:putative exporter of polyketide antibiotics
MSKKENINSSRGLGVKIENSIYVHEAPVLSGTEEAAMIQLKKTGENRKDISASLAKESPCKVQQDAMIKRPWSLHPQLFKTSLIHL